MDLAESQVLGLLDELENQLKSYGLEVMDPTTSLRIPIFDLQLTRDNRISYRLRESQ
jgi:hypothetical protein